MQTLDLGEQEPQVPTPLIELLCQHAQQVVLLVILPGPEWDLALPDLPLQGQNEIINPCDIDADAFLLWLEILRPESRRRTIVREKGPSPMIYEMFQNETLGIEPCPREKHQLIIRK